MIDARLDLKRRERLGMVEAVWGEHKTAKQIITILERFSAADELGLVTRVSPEKADAVLAALPAVTAHADARCLTLGELPAPPPGPPQVAVLSGGSSDRSAEAISWDRSSGVVCPQPSTVTRFARGMTSSISSCVTAGMSASSSPAATSPPEGPSPPRRDAGCQKST